MNLSGKTYYREVIRNVRMIVCCGICRHTQKLQFHHIKPTKLNGDSRGSSKRAYDIVKNPDCYIPLCYFCHKKVTSGEITISREGWNDLLVWDDTWDGKWRMIHVIR